MMNYETGDVPKHLRDTMNKCACGHIWAGRPSMTCATCLAKLGCRNDGCESNSECWRYSHGEGDGAFEPRLHADRCDWFILEEHRPLPDSKPLTVFEDVTELASAGSLRC
jgi:hypothetical protein